VQDASIRSEAAGAGAFDLIIEASGFSPVAFESMEALARNGVLVLVSVTGGMRAVEVPTDRINLEFDRAPEQDRAIAELTVAGAV
jgi:threonine dehydrogenase-like Zn-dependent dehydrogenase